jgi:hypothetical protein
MSLETNLETLATRVATEFKTIRTSLTGNASGSLAALTTDQKGSFVAAINELDAAIEALASAEGGATINDSTTSGAQVWSSSKTSTEISAAIAALIDSAPGVLDTLNELAAALGDDPDFATTISGQIAGKVSLTGDETIAGTKTFSSAPVVPDASFSIAKTSGLQGALDAKAPLASPNFTGTPTVPTAAPGTNNTQAASTEYVDAAAAAVTVADASTTVKGKVELATDAEAVSGVSTTHAITPANLAAVVGDSTTDFVAVFEAGLE